jgi:rSAM-associated Gly-rich repeat protein
MSLRQKYLRILAGIVPIGAAGVSLLLGSAAPVAADQGPAAAQARPADAAPVSERLAAIRDVVSDVAGSAAKAAETRQQLAWVAWRNGGGGGWRNGGGGWRNGGGGWRNGGGGWRNGGGAWGNGGWHNGWHNYWHNW